MVLVFMDRHGEPTRLLAREFTRKGPFSIETTWFPVGLQSKKSLNLPYLQDHSESVRTKLNVTKNVLKLNITVYGFARIFNFGESLNRFVRHGNRLLTSETSKRILMGQ